MAYVLCLRKTKKLVENSVDGENAVEFVLWKKANRMKQNSSGASLPPLSVG
jgi:hypothetical protein